MKKRRFITGLSAVMMFCSLAGTSAFAANYYDAKPDDSYWDKFIKYDLCITDYDSLTDEEKELCKFIFETEQGTDETIICERARRTLAHDENIGERITIDDLNDCYGIWDRYSYSKMENSWDIHCVPDIKHLDGWDDYNEYWLDDEGKVKVISTGENSGSWLSSFKVEISSEPYPSQYNESYEINRKNPYPTYRYEYIDGAEKIEAYNLLDVDGDYYFICPDNTAAFVKSKYSARSLRDGIEPITEPFVVPDEIEGYPVVAIEAEAFQFAPLTKVVLPETIDFIDSWAFDGCVYLEEITLPERLEYIGRYAFSGTALEKNRTELS